MPALAQTTPDLSQDPGRLVAKAVCNAAQRLGLTQADLAEIIGVSPSTVSRMHNGGLAVSGKTYELAVYLIRVFRSLDAFAGGDADTTKHWIANMNTHLDGRPRDLMKSAHGLIDVMNYLDDARAPV